ncbi:putative non-specific serine/threonine protein kinase [Helianthus annuus]|nr:putative non-specific serine/threonine protein kinase [Helianthus annuus]
MTFITTWWCYGKHMVMVMGAALKGPGGAPDPPNFSLSSVMSGNFRPPGRKSQASPLVMVTILFIVFLSNPVTSQPQTNLILRACAQINATNPRNFFRNLNETFSDTRRKLSNNNTYFATSEQTNNTDPVYVLAQCRNYMSAFECVNCFDFASKSVRSCDAAVGGRVVLDGCFLRVLIHLR